jgi:hypothetical protein
MSAALLFRYLPVDGDTSFSAGRLAKDRYGNGLMQTEDRRAILRQERAEQAVLREHSDPRA